MIKNLDAKIFIHIPKSGGMTIRHSPQLKNKIMACTPELHESPEYTKGLLKKNERNPGSSWISALSLETHKAGI